MQAAEDPDPLPISEKRLVAAGTAQPLAIITGGSSGIGLACARLLGAKGCRVALIGRDEARLAAAREELKRDGLQNIIIRDLDVRDGNACKARIEELAEEFGAPEWVINSAGIVEPGRFLEQSLMDHEAQMQTNYLGSLYIAHAVAPIMAKHRRGRLVFISSGAGLFGIMGYGAYSPSKFAVRGLAEVLRVELAPFGVGVCVAFPPDTDTPQLAYEAARRPPETSAFAGSGGLWSAEAIAANIIKTAERGRFAATPGWQMTAVHLLQGLLAPWLRAKQQKTARSFRSKE